MGFTDEIVSSAIGAAENKLEGKAKEEKRSFAGGCLKFIISTIWVVFTLAASIVALLAMCVGSVADFLGAESGKAICIAAIAISVLIFLITFMVPFLRRKGSTTRRLGVLALGDALWWIYLMFTL